MFRSAVPLALCLTAAALTGTSHPVAQPARGAQQPGPSAAPGSAKLLFSSGFEGATQLAAPGECYGTGCWQDIFGSDGSTGFSWPPRVWGGGPTRLQLLADARVDAVTIHRYMGNQIRNVTGRDGKPTRALYSEIKQSGCCGIRSQGDRPAQNPLMLQPIGEEGDLYIRYWLKLQPDLAQMLVPPNWRSIFEFKTAGDYRVIASVVTWGIGAPLSWHVIGDNEANGGLRYERFWESYNTTVPIPIGKWFRFEVFWHRSGGGDGRVWMAVNGQVIVDRRGANMGVKKASIDRIMITNLYSGSGYPIYQWLDDLQIWSGFPPDAAPN